MPKKYNPDQHPAQIMRLAGLGFTLDEIAVVLDIGTATLDAWLKKPEVFMPYKKGRLEAKDRLVSTLYRKAIKGDTASLIFYLKSQWGWRETDKSEDKGAGVTIAVGGGEWIRALSPEESELLAKYKRGEDSGTQE